MINNDIKMNGDLQMIGATSRKNLSLGFPTRPDTNQAVQQQKMAMGLKFRIWEVERLYLSSEISFLVTMMLICTVVFTYMQKADFLMRWLK